MWRAEAVGRKAYGLTADGTSMDAFVEGHGLQALRTPLTAGVGGETAVGGARHA
ncbi:hypothetical protein ACFYPZ_23270 [Streptomyces sp. NPDC005506]|uniref:hypothetical protein n=1 Tax=unclassified Streptomyces TaxID=2593676 RepID=UPI0036ABB93C